MENYSNRELDAKFIAHEQIDAQRFQEANDKMDEHFEATMGVLADIKTQTTKTNGSVAAVKEWKAFASGAFYVLSGVIVLLVLPWLGFISWRVLDLDNQIQDSTKAAVLDALANYHIQPK